MTETDLYIVGVPGMGNSDPSWHQRRPFGFARAGRGREHLRAHTVRRPSTASGRFSGSSSQTPGALTANRTEYWSGHRGLRHDGSAVGGSSQSLAAAAASRTGPVCRGRPSSAGCRRSPPSADSANQHSALSPRVIACTRPPAGVVRGGGRDGWAAPPGTPPPRSPSLADHPSQPTAPKAPGASRPPQAHGRPPRVSSSEPTGLMAPASQESSRVADVARRGCTTTACVARTDAISSHQSAVREKSANFPVPQISTDDAGHFPRRQQGGYRADAEISGSRCGVKESRELCWRQGRAVYQSSAEGRDHMVFKQRPASASPMRTTCEMPAENSRQYYRSTRQEDQGGRGYSSRKDSPLREGRARQFGLVRPRSACASTSRRPDHFGRSHRPVSADAGRMLGGFQSTGNGAQRGAVIPDFVASEKQVLRFFGYFTEELDRGCSGTLIERERAGPAVSVRQVIVYLYLVDGSLEIFESRQTNSGQQGGLLLKRNIFKKRDGSLYSFRDLKVRSDLMLLGRLYRLTRCDDYTRRWYERQGLRQPRSELDPEQTETPLRVEHTTGLCLSNRPYSATSRASVEAPTRTSCTARLAVQDKVRRFFRHDSEVLRFKAIWDNPNAGGAPRRYDLLFYLEDETIALLNPREDRHNSGRDEGAVCVRRQRLPKDWRFRGVGTCRGQGDRDVEECISERDLAVGGVVHVWGRNLRLVGCDQFTKRYYRWCSDVPTSGEKWSSDASPLQICAAHEERRSSRVSILSRPRGATMQSNSLRYSAAYAPRIERCSDTRGDLHLERHQLWASDSDRLVARQSKIDPASRENHAASLHAAADANDRVVLRREIMHTLSKETHSECGSAHDYIWGGIGRYEEDRDRLRNRPGTTASSKSNGESLRLTNVQQSVGGALPPDRYKGRCLRCKAILDSDHPNDRGREFVVMYDLGWDTLMVYELQRRNSGRPGGLFLVKGRHRRPDGRGKQRYYAAQDLYLGASLPLATGHTLIVTEMDRSSLKLCEEFPQDFPRMDYKRVLRRIAQRAMSKRLNLRKKLYRHAVENNSSRSWSKYGKAGGEQAAVLHTPAKATTAVAAMLPRRAAGQGPVIGLARTSPRASNSVSSAQRRGGREREIACKRQSPGRSARTGNTWGLVGGWGDADTRCTVAALGAPRGEGHFAHSSSQTGNGAKSRRYCGVDNPKNISATAPWATVYSKHSEREPDLGQDGGRGYESPSRAEAATSDTCCSFRDPAAFRDAMDLLGLFIGLGQQEVLTLVRAYIGQNQRILWASMCDAISSIASTMIDGGVSPAETAEGSRERSVVGGTAGLTGQSADAPIFQRMREASVDWRRTFSSAEASTKQIAEGVLGVASVVQTIRRCGVGVGPGDASLMATLFRKGEGSQVDYNLLCDAVYPCDFSDEGVDSARFTAAREIASTNAVGTNMSSRAITPRVNTRTKHTLGCVDETSRVHGRDSVNSVCHVEGGVGERYVRTRVSDPEAGTMDITDDTAEEARSLWSNNGADRVFSHAGDVAATGEGRANGGSECWDEEGSMY